MTYTIIFLNIMMFLMTMGPEKDDSSGFFQNKNNLLFTGHLYEQFQQNHPEMLVVPVSKNVDPTSDQYFLWMGAKALRDVQFLKNSSNEKFEGDQVAIVAWKKKISDLVTSFKEKPSAYYGLSSLDKNKMRWVTYQFMHAGFMHLLSNMVFFLIFGTAIELLFGALPLAILYILSGIAGAWGFILITPPTLAPMIGASGALTGLMAFYFVMETKKRIPFFYFISPVDGYFGWIHLPTLLIIPLCFLSDITALISTPANLAGAVAYSAHLGGMLFGFVAAIICRWMSIEPQLIYTPPKDESQITEPEAFR